MHQHFGDRPDQTDELTLIINLNSNGEADGELYEDAGEGWGFRDGEYRRLRFIAKKTGPWVSVRTVKTDGNMPRGNRTVNVRLLMPDGTERTATGQLNQPITVTVN